MSAVTYKVTNVSKIGVTLEGVTIAAGRSRSITMTDIQYNNFTASHGRYLSFEAGTASGETVDICPKGAANTIVAPVAAAPVNTGPQEVTGTVNAVQSGIWTSAVTQSGAWTAAVSQTGTWNVNAAQTGTWNVNLRLADQDITTSNPLFIRRQDTLPVAATAVTAVGVLASFDTTGYQSIAIQLHGTFVGTVVYESSNDGTTWFLHTGYTPANTGNALSGSSDTTPQLKLFSVSGRLFRVRASVYTSGTINANKPQWVKFFFTGSGLNTIQRIESSLMNTDEKIDLLARTRIESARLVYYANRSTPQVVKNGQKAKPKAGYGKVVKTRKATKEEEAQLRKGKWIRTRKDGKKPGDKGAQRSKYRPHLAKLSK